MKAYTNRYGHLVKLPDLKVGDVVLPGQVIGRMGSTGKSKFNHLHHDTLEGLISEIARLGDIGYEPHHKYTPNIRQLNYSIDKKLFRHPIIITTYYYDPRYKVRFKIDHPAYDVVPKDRHISKKHFNIHWNRSKKGIVLAVGFDEGGYGYYILIGYNA